MIPLIVITLSRTIPDHNKQMITITKFLLILDQTPVDIQSKPLYVITVLFAEHNSDH